jgi:uncharacterized membrane protein YphA (DoxX/SURF4 family)
VIKKLRLHPLVVWGCRLIVAVVLIFAAVQKIWMPLEFARLIREYHLLPDQVLNLVAVILPWLEIVCGLCFLSGLWLMGTAALLSSLNIIFVIAIAYRAWLIMASTGVGFFDLSYDCGCGFGVVYIPTKILENLLLVGMCLIILFAQRKRNAKDTA